MERMVIEHARCLGAMLDPISMQVAKTMESQCDPPVLVALLQLRQDWHRLLCELLKASVSSDILPPEQLVDHLLQSVSHETDLLRDLAASFTEASPEKTEQYALAWMEVREINEELIEFYLED